MNIDNMEIDEIRQELENKNISFHFNMGDKKLRELLRNSLENTCTPNPQSSAVPKDKREREAMKLVRIIVSPNDPAIASHPGMIFTVGSSKINKGRMIKKMVPFNNEEGWHVPNIIYQQIKNATMQKFKTVKAANGEKQLVPYLTRRYNVEVLEPLSKEEIKKLANAQKSRGDT